MNAEIRTGFCGVGMGRFFSAMRLIQKIEISEKYTVDDHEDETSISTTISLDTSKFELVMLYAK